MEMGECCSLSEGKSWSVSLEECLQWWSVIYRVAVVEGLVKKNAAQAGKDIVAEWWNV